MSLTANGKATTAAAKTSSSSETVTIRRASLRDGPQIGRVAGITYYNTPLTSWIYPHREKYHSQYEFRAIERTINKMLSPRNETYVACTASGTIVGEAQFVRLGDDAGARKMIREVGVVKRVLMWMASWVFWVYCKLWWWLEGGDKSVDAKAAETFAGWCKLDNEKHWESHDERASRWHAQSVVVLPEWQGKGIGKKLMAEVMKKAQRDMVIVGLEASVKGEGLYIRLGFELLDRFSEGADLFEDGGKGGVMAWYPEGYKDKAASGEM
jgi:ribosomal protein S18 acetylase RimI-like enzyme